MFKLSYILNVINKKKYNNKFKLSVLNLNNKFLFQLELIFKLSSTISNKNRFILMLILLEKYMNNQLIFLIDRHTLSNKKYIKVGYILNLQNEFLYSFIEFNNLYNVPKENLYDIFHNFLKLPFLKYEKNKLLSNLVFNLDYEINSYYDYLNDFSYNIIFFFKTIFNNMSYNKYLLKLNGNIFILFNDNISENDIYYSLYNNEDNENSDFNESSDDEIDNYLIGEFSNIYIEKNINNNNVTSENIVKYTDYYFYILDNKIKIKYNVNILLNLHTYDLESDIFFFDSILVLDILISDELIENLLLFDDLNL